MDTRISRDTNNNKNVLNSRKASNSRTASNSMIQRYRRNPNNTLATTGMSAIADQQEETIRNLKNASISKNAYHCLDASNSSDTSNNSKASSKQH
jgi:hypothetical protein